MRQRRSTERPSFAPAAGWKLIESVDVIAERTGVGRAFIGMILVASVTSLPELSTGISAVAIAHAPDLAVGDVVGSCIFNLLLFALADAASRNVAFYGRLSASHNLTAAFSMILMGLLALALLAPTTAGVSIGHVGLYSIGLAALYLAGARLLYVVDLQTARDVTPSPEVSRMTLRAAALRCASASLAVILAGVLLVSSANTIAERAGLADSFVGVLLLAAATSLPELVTVLVAVRMHTYDLAAGNLLGSNLFNMMVLAIDDLAYGEGPLLAAASPALAMSAVIAMTMTAVIVAALTYVRRSEPHPVDAWAGATLLGLYVLNAWLTYAAQS